MDQVEKQAIKEPKSFPVLQPMFRNNVGIDGVVFPNTHPYFDNDKRIVEVAKQGANVARFSDPDENGYQLVYKSKQGKNVKISFEHNEDELCENFRLSKIVCDNKHNVELPPYLTGKKNDGKKNVDAIVDTKKADYKTPNKNGDVTNPMKSIYSAIKAANTQRCEIVIIELDKIKSIITQHQLTQSFDFVGV